MFRIPWKCLLIVLMLMLVCLSACADPSANPALIPHQNMDGLWGYVDIDGTTVLPHQWLFCDVFRGAGYARVRTLDGYDAILRMDGTYAVPPDEHVTISGDMAGTYYGGMDTGVFWLDNNDRTAFFDVTCGYLSAFRYHIATDPWFNGEDSSLLRVTEDGHTYGYVNRHTGEQIIPYLFAQINLDGFHNGFAIEELAQNGAYVIVKEDGTFTSMPSAMVPVPGALVEDGLLLVRDANTGLYGYCDTNCEWVINPIYEDATSFESGMATVDEKGNRRLIDTRGRYVEEAPAHPQR